MAVNEHITIDHMVDVLCSFDASKLVPNEVRDSLVSLERLRSSAEAAQAALMTAMLDEAQRHDAEADARRGNFGDDLAIPTGSREEFVVDEVSALLSCTKVAASHRFGVALGARRHPALHKAWATGDICGRKVAEISEQVEAIDQPGTVGSLAVPSVVDAAIEYGKERTVPQLRSWLKRRVIEAAPEAAERRRVKALADRRVTLTPVGDDMAELWALLPAVQGLHIRKLLDSLAMSGATSEGDIRTADQRRADALVDLITGDAPAPSVDISVVVSAETVGGEGGEPAELTGYGPVTIGSLPGLFDGGDSCGGFDEPTWRRLVADPTTGVLTDVTQQQYRPSGALDRAVRARDMTCRFPGCRRSAAGKHSGVDLDHTVAWPQGETTARNLAALCRHHHRLKHSAGWRVHLNDDATMTWTTPTGATFVTRPWEYSRPLPNDDATAGRPNAPPRRL